MAKVLASRVSGHHLGTQSLKKFYIRIPKCFGEEFLKMAISSKQLFFFHLSVALMVLNRDIKPFVNKMKYITLIKNNFKILCEK